MFQKRKKPPPREPNDEEKDIITRVRHCARELDDILQGARRKAQVDAFQFSYVAASMMFKGVDSYADMYDKLKVKSRSALNMLFQRARDLDEMVDAQDALDETEGCWKNFLTNIDVEIEAKKKAVCSSLAYNKEEGDYIDLSKHPLVDCETFQECTLMEKLSSFTSTLLILQPSYLPDLAARYRSSEVQKVVVS